MREKFAVVMCTAATLALSVGTAAAGEITGFGKPTAGPLHANSVCVYSARNDDPGAAHSLDLSIAANGPGGVSQSYGQDVKLGLDPHEFNPGDACRGGSN